jgi:dihydroorotate dehydrogenase electron transfer subunit
MSISLQTHLPRTYRIKEIAQNTEMVRTYTFEGTLGAKPGQLVMVWLPGVDEVPLSVAYDSGGIIKITFFACGDMTHELAKRNVGDLVGLRGPFGTSYTWEEGQHIVMVAGGYGAAPMYFVASEAVHHGCTMQVIIGARSKEHLLYREELEALDHITLHIATNDGSAGEKGMNTDILERLLQAQRDGTSSTVPIDKVFTCGPEMMLKKVSDICDQYNMPAQISLSRYMKCGYGICGNCVVDSLGIRLCSEGPVVSNDIARHIADFGAYARDMTGKKQYFDPQKKFDGMGSIHDSH